MYIHMYGYGDRYVCPFTVPESSMPYGADSEFDHQ